MVIVVTVMIVITVFVMMPGVRTLGLAFTGIHHPAMAVTHHVAHHLAHPLVTVFRVVHVSHSETGPH
jgi:hypothetical protein